MNFKEGDIRPQDLEKKCDELREEDLKVFFSDTSKFVTVNCPACHSASYKRQFEKGIFSFCECERCETLFINPRPTHNMLADFYTNSKSIQFWNDKIFPASEDTRRQSIFAPRAQRVGDLCRKYLTEAKMLLDVGAGFGTFCEEATKLNIFQKVIAVEPAQGLAQTCRNKGIEVIEKTIEKADLNQAISVITNFELIEHLFDPIDFVKACHSALINGGLFIVTTPNIKGFDLMTLGPISDNIIGPNHMNYFYPKSIKILLERCGFEVIEILTPGKLDAEIVHNKILNGYFDVSGQPFLRHILINEWEKLGKSFQYFLASNLLSSHLWVVARK